MDAPFDADTPLQTIETDDRKPNRLKGDECSVRQKHTPSAFSLPNHMSIRSKLTGWVFGLSSGILADESDIDL
ncbi:uncharacterized protein Dmul_17720 [Desulfococcus multivorans]|nr:uncharacterized protein Dmul_17720 [Desulfococcus multivorans]